MTDLAPNNNGINWRSWKTWVKLLAFNLAVSIALALAAVSTAAIILAVFGPGDDSLSAKAVHVGVMLVVLALLTLVLVLMIRRWNQDGVREKHPQSSKRPFELLTVWPLICSTIMIVVLAILLRHLFELLLGYPRGIIDSDFFFLFSLWPVVNIPLLLIVMAKILANHIPQNSAT